MERSSKRGFFGFDIWYMLCLSRTMFVTVVLIGTREVSRESEQQLCLCNHLCLTMQAVFVHNNGILESMNAL